MIPVLTKSSDKTTFTLHFHIHSSYKRGQEPSSSLNQTNTVNNHKSRETTSSTMRSAILIVALAFGIDFGVDATATATRQEQYHASEYADALDELEQEIGSSGVRRPAANEEDARQSNGGQKRRGATQRNMEEREGFKKKVDRRKAERERRAMEDIEKLNDNDDRPHSPGNGNANNNNNERRDLRQQFHQRQEEKKVQLGEMHRKVSDALEAHHEGRELLGTDELEHHTRRKNALERKRRSLEEETPERVRLYIILHTLVIFTIGLVTFSHNISHVHIIFGGKYLIK